MLPVYMYVYPMHTQYHTCIEARREESVMAPETGWLWATGQVLVIMELSPLEE